MSYTTTPTLSTISFQILFVTIYQFNAFLNCDTGTHYQGRQAQIIQWSPKQMQSSLQVNCFLTNKMSTQTQLSLIPKLKFNYGNVTNMIRILRSGQISICNSWYQKMYDWVFEVLFMSKITPYRWNDNKRYRGKNDPVPFIEFSSIYIPLFYMRCMIPHVALKA